MKSIVCMAGVACLAFGLAWGAQAQQLGAPRLVLSQPEWNFGQVWQDERPSFTLVVKNEGPAELKILEVRST
ncbi:MAG: hypothetical protein KAY37_08875 [Phycisphaerae bacterium]|nr:hypothetical protein [Phycisphaerae bacterium]